MQVTKIAGWEYAGLYYDEGVTGTKLAKRDGLLRLLDDCDKGLIDYIIVKSISRFSRNTVDSIEIVRKLYQDGIYIYFEKEFIRIGRNPLFSRISAFFFAALSLICRLNLLEKIRR